MLDLYNDYIVTDVNPVKMLDQVYQSQIKSQNFCGISQPTKL